MKNLLLQSIFNETRKVWQVRKMVMFVSLCFVIILVSVTSYTAKAEQGNNALNLPIEVPANDTTSRNISSHSVMHRILQDKLPYSEGGPEVEYPDPQGKTIRYIDAVNGKDAWDGGREQPWQTLNKAVTALQTLPSGTHVLLRRGCTWNETWESNCFNSTDGNRYVIGAYGPVNEPKPIVFGNVRVRHCSYWMVRDLDVNGQLLYFMTNNSIFFNNNVHGWNSNGIAVHGGTHHIAVVQNLVYDGNSNDPISIHDSGWKFIPEEIYLKNGYWVVDNIIIGNSGLEECIDVAGNGWRNGLEFPQDIKIINNRLQCSAVSPSTKRGSANRPFNLAHSNKYVWVIGNIGANGRGEGIYATDNSNYTQVLDWFQFSSNIMFKNRKAIISSSTTNSIFKYNTLLCSSDPVAVQFARNTTNVKFIQTLICTGSGIFSFAPDIQTPVIDSNWYSPSAPSPLVQNDTHSQAGEVPGAFLADGTRQGLTMEPFPGCENNGYGWAGPLIIQARYPMPGRNTGIIELIEKQEGKVILNETFSYPDEPLPSYMWSEGCRAEIKNGHLFVDADTTSYRQSTIWLDRKLSGNLRIEFDVHIVSSADNADNINCFFLYSSPDGKALKASCHERVDGMYSQYHKMNGYIFTNVTTGDGMNGRFRLRGNPGFHLLAEKGGYENRKGKTYHIEIEKTRNKISYSIDAKKVIDYVIPDGSPYRYDTGLFGFRTWHTAIWWDNLKIVQIE